MLPEIKAIEGEIIVNATGSIYVKEATFIRESTLQYIKQGYNKFIIDLKGVDYIDSSGLGVLVAIHKRATEKGGHVIIRGLNGNVRELFELTRLTKVFEIRD